MEAPVQDDDGHRGDQDECGESDPEGRLCQEAVLGAVGRHETLLRHQGEGNKQAQEGNEPEHDDQEASHMNGQVLQCEKRQRCCSLGCLLRSKVCSLRPP